MGISLDEHRDAAKQFLKEHDHPGIVLWDDHAARGTDKSLFTYYGLMGVPTVFLVGPDGKVISVQAIGKTLRRKWKNCSAQPRQARGQRRKKRRGGAEN